MKSIPITDYDGLRVANSAGNMQITLGNKKLTGSNTKTKALGIKADNFEMSDEIRQRAIDFYNSFTAETWTQYLADERKNEYLNMKKSFESSINSFKLEAKMAAHEAIERDFA